MKELLGLLDLSKETFWSWLVSKGIMVKEQSFADLAFQLRDEVGDRPELWMAFYLVYAWRRTPEAKRDMACLVKQARTHWNYWEDYARLTIMAKPAYFIVAALIAKELQ